MPLLPINGFDYNVERTGSGQPIVLLHGFTGSTAIWNSLISLLSPTWDVIAIDLPGHGKTSAPADPARYEAHHQLADLVAILDTLRIEQTVWLGYSMGGRVALSFAVAHPERVRALILESGSPGVTPPEDRDTRVKADNALAETIERDGIAAFVDRWEALPMFASHTRLPAETRARMRAQRLASDPVGLANSLRGFGQGVQPALHDRLPEIRMPVCLIAGDEDEKYHRLAIEMSAAIPGAESHIIQHSGHTPHVEQTDEFNRIVLDFLARLTPARSVEVTTCS